MKWCDLNCLLSPRLYPVQTLAERIKQRRTQMFLHSFLYYGLDKPQVSDATFDRWARELVDLQRMTHNIGFHDEQFLGWTGATGCHLKPPQWIIRKANKWINRAK